MKFTFIIDPIQLLDPGHDTSVALMEAATEMGHEVWITQATLLNINPLQLVIRYIILHFKQGGAKWFIIGVMQ